MMPKRFPFPSNPIGWFAVGFSSDFAPEAVVTKQVFGQDLVLYRTSDGKLHASDPHCPHLGAHLGHGGRVEGDTLRCPFHGWCFDGVGQCVSIPGAQKLPPKPVLRMWPLLERNGVVLVHHHPDGAAPAWEPPPLVEEGWTKNRTVTWKVKTHPQEVMENTVDCAHLIPIHHVDKADIIKGPVEDGPMMNVVINLIADGAIVGMPGMPNDVILDVTLHGLGHTVVQSEVRNVGIRARQRIYCTPINEDHIEIRGVINLAALGDEHTTEQVAELFYQAFVIDFAMDFPVWENKVYRDKPLLSSADGPFVQYRKWAKQFYGESVAG